MAKVVYGPFLNRFSEPTFRPYVTVIGQLALAWNDLHEKLGMLFCSVMGGGWVERPFAIWNSATFDRPKREMLLAAVNSATAREQAPFPRMVEDITWLLTEATKLEDQRNNAVHSPLVMNMNFFSLARGREPVAPDDALKNPRAIKLALKVEGKNLLMELRWIRDATLTLRDFSVRLDRALSGRPWPDKPKLPARQPKNARPDPIRQLRLATRLRLPRPFRE